MYIVLLLQEQNEEIQAIQAELTKAEADLRDANEKELPEASFQKVVDTKRKELQDLMETYAKENAKDNAQETNAAERKHFERPSERRKRLEEQGGASHGNENRYDHHEEGHEDDAFQHFGGRNRHAPSSRRGGDGGSDYGH